MLTQSLGSLISKVGSYSVGTPMGPKANNIILNKLGRDNSYGIIYLCFGIVGKEFPHFPS